MTGRTPLLRSTVAVGLASLFVNLAFPKAGFYVGEVPITAGYALLGAAGALALATLLLRHWTLPRATVWTIAALLPWIGASATLLVLGENQDGFVSAFSFLVSAALVPILTLLTTSLLLRSVAPRTLRRIVLAALGVVTAWGLVHFVAMNVFGAFPGIPFLTVTGSELDLADSRNINRGGIFKMVSTYNNGNILGVNALTWFPAAFALAGPHVRWRGAWLGAPRGVFLFSLSRTVWAGWLVMEVVNTVFARRTLTRLAGMGLSLPLVLAGVVVVAAVLAANPFDFLFDRDLGGRIDQFRFEVAWLRASFIGMQEIVYTSILASFGVVGLALFLLAWTFPLLLPAHGPVAKAAKVGMITYLFVMVSDGAFPLIPTQHTYWMVAALAVAGPRTQGDAS
ncbi:MAG: hypothetical protein RI554_11100 [Trueperaceae bacterium]|nr:hypothetical protein [Trueperaceae bacterium]